MNIGRRLQFDPDEALGLSKSSFYQAFGSKQQLFERCLKRYRDTVAAAMLACLNQAGSGRQFIEDMLSSVVDEACSGERPRGCLVMNTANEFAQGNPGVAEWVS